MVTRIDWEAVLRRERVGGWRCDGICGDLNPEERRPLWRRGTTLPLLRSHPTIFFSLTLLPPPERSLFPQRRRYDLGYFPHNQICMYIIWRCKQYWIQFMETSGPLSYLLPKKASKWNWHFLRNASCGKKSFIDSIEACFLFTVEIMVKSLLTAAFFSSLQRPGWCFLQH